MLACREPSSASLLLISFCTFCFPMLSFLFLRNQAYYRWGARATAGGSIVSCFVFSPQAFHSIIDALSTHTTPRQHTTPTYITTSHILTYTLGLGRARSILAGQWIGSDKDLRRVGEKLFFVSGKHLAGSFHGHSILEEGGGERVLEASDSDFGIPRDHHFGADASFIHVCSTTSG